MNKCLNIQKQLLSDGTNESDDNFLPVLGYVKAKGRLYIRCIYRNLPNCEDQRSNGNVRTNLLNAIKALSKRWRGLCNNDCDSVTSMTLTCGGSTSGRKRRSPAADMDVLVTIDNVELEYNLFLYFMFAFLSKCVSGHFVHPILLCSSALSP